jgi:hypothetical protein
MFIVNPKNKNKYNLFGRKGKSLLKCYIKHYNQYGGMHIQLNRQNFKNAENFGRDECVLNALQWLGIDVINSHYSHLLGKGLTIEETKNNIKKFASKIQTPRHRMRHKFIEFKEPINTKQINFNEKGIKPLIQNINIILSYLDNMEAMLINVIFKPEIHSVVIGKDKKAIPFLVELQINEDETDIGKCKHIPYGFNDILIYFSNVETCYIFENGLKLNDKHVEKRVSPAKATQKRTKAHAPRQRESKPPQEVDLTEPWKNWEIQATQEVDFTSPWASVKNESSLDKSSPDDFTYNLRGDLMQARRDMRMFSQVEQSSDQDGSYIDGYDGYDGYSELWDFLEKDPIYSVQANFVPIIESGRFKASEFKNKTLDKKTQYLKNILKKDLENL